MIEDVIQRVDQLVAPMSQLPFDAFDRREKDQWAKVIQEFDEAVVRIEKEAVFFVDESFKTLRSAEGAFDMLRNFEGIRSRAAINDQLKKKIDNVLDKFGEELEVVAELFHAHKDNPPISKNQPVVAGSIKWAQSLFLRVKRTILKFQT